MVLEELIQSLLERVGRRQFIVVSHSKRIEEITMNQPDPHIDVGAACMVQIVSIFKLCSSNELT